MNISSMKRLLRQILIIFGYDGLLLIQKIEKSLIGISISKERNMFVAEGFLSNLVEKYGQHSVSTHGERKWYPQACKFLNLNLHIHSPYDKSIIERTVQFIKDRTECFDD